MPDADITVIFEPPLQKPEAIFVLDGKRIQGELEEDYFFYQPERPLNQGKHTLIVMTPSDTVEFDFLVEGEIQISGKSGLNYLNIGAGGEFNSSPETLAFTTYPRGRYPLFSGEIDIDIGNLHITGTYLKDPEYPLGWYGILDVDAEHININGGSITPVYSEITMYSPYGAGVEFTGKYRKSALNVVYMKSIAYDTLISEFQRKFLCLRANIESTLVFTMLKGEDDTASFTGFPIELPVSGIIYAGRLNLHYGEFTLYGELAHSKGVFNMYIPVSVTGKAMETGIKWHDFSLYYRRIDSLYLPLGNPYIDRDRKIVLEGTAKRGIFSFQTTSYAILNFPYGIEGYNLSLYSTIGTKQGINLGLQAGNDEGYYTLTGNLGGFIYRTRFSLSGIINLGYTEGYGNSGSFTGNFYLNLLPLLLNSSLTYTWGTQREVSVSIAPELHLGQFRFSLEYRTILASDYTETSLKTLLNFQPGP